MQTDPPSPPRGGRRAKLGLSLAGGGFRASLFHLGVLQRMAELDLLRYVELLSTVSGGSIIGALYILLLQRSIRTNGRDLPQPEYERIVKELHGILVGGIRKNLRTRLLWNPFGVLKVLLSADSLGARMARLYERHLYDRALAPDDPKRGDRPGEIALRDVRLFPDWKTGGIEDYNRTAAEAHQSVITSLILNATSLNSGAPFRFSSVEMGDLRLGSCRYDEIKQLEPRKRLVQGVRLRELIAALETPGDGEVSIRGKPYPRRMVRWAWWWRAREEGASPPPPFEPVFDGGLPPDSLRQADFAHLRLARISAWYLTTGLEKGVSGAVPGDVLAARFWEALRNIDERLESDLHARVDADPSISPAVLGAFLEAYWLRGAVALSPRIARDWMAIRLGDAVGASACFPPVFPPYVILNFFDDLVVTRLGLTDGGVFDNIGLATLIEEGCNYIIASDTGGLFDIDQRVSSGRLGMGGRIIGIVTERVGTLQRNALRHARRVSQAIEQSGVTAPTLSDYQASYALDGLAYFHIQSPATTTPGVDGGFDARALANLRTDLDAFGEVEVAALVNHGYETADRFIREKLSTPGPPFVPATPWPAPTDPPMPLPLDDRTRRIVGAGKSRFFRPLLLWDSVSWAITISALIALVWATWGLPISSTAAAGVAWAQDSFLRSWFGWVMRILDTHAVGIGQVIVGAVVCLAVARWAWPAFVAFARARWPRTTRAGLTMLKWLRSWSGNVFWLAGGAPAWISLGAALAAWTSYLAYGLPFLSATRVPGTDGTRHAVSRLARVVGGLALVTLTVGVVMSVRATFTHRADLPHGVHGPVLAIELARSEDDVRLTVGEPGSHDRDVMREAVHIDFAFIVAYWLLLVGMSTLLDRGGGARPFRLPAMAAIAATGAAAADVKENLAILSLLDTVPGGVTATPHDAALVKWGLFFLVLALFGVVLTRRGGWLRVLGLLFLASALVGFAGLVHYPAIEWAMLPTLLALLATTGTLLAARPGWMADALGQRVTAAALSGPTAPLQPVSGS